MFFIKRIKAAFRQGSGEKNIVLKAISEAVRDEYTEDNAYSRIYWLIEQMLINNPEFKEGLRIDHIKKGLEQVVDDVANEVALNKRANCI